MRSVVVVVGLFASSACSTYVQHRAALVPHATPVQNIGQANQWRGTASLGATNIVDVQRPGIGDPNAGVAIPSRQLRGSIGLGITESFSMSLLHERGLASSAQPVKDTLPPLDDRTVAGGGLGMTYSIDTHSPWRIGLSAEIIGWNVPFVEYSTCIENCPTRPPTYMTRDTQLVMSLGLGIVPSYRTGDLTFFGGITGRNHPTIAEKVVSDGTSADVTAGPFNATAHAGVAFDATDRVRFRLDVHQTLTQDPVVYGPGFGFAFEVGFGNPIPKRPLPTESSPDGVPIGAPGTVPPRRAPTPTEVEAARSLVPEAQASAKAGECDRTKQIVARIYELDAATHAAVTQDRLVAYCISP